jgi:hypothetical protein
MHQLLDEELDMVAGSLRLFKAGDELGMPCPRASQWTNLAGARLVQVSVCLCDKANDLHGYTDGDLAAVDRQPVTISVLCTPLKMC